MDSQYSLNELLSNWLSELKIARKYSNHTILAYQNDISDFFCFLQNHSGGNASVATLKNAKAMDFRAWISSRVNKKISARSNARAISSLKSFMKYLARLDLVDLKAINCIKRAKLSFLLPKPIDEGFLLKFLDRAKFFDNDLEWITDRDRALYTVLYCSGMRISEVLNLKLSDIRAVIKINGKGKKDRIVVMLEIAIERVKRYVQSCPYDLADGYLFVGLRGKKLNASLVDSRLQKLSAMCDLPEHISAHSFRHSFATHMIKNGADLRSVQELLGHESLSSTQIYTALETDNMMKAYSKFHPLESGNKIKTENDL